MAIKNTAFLSLQPIFQPIVWDIMNKLELKGWQPQVIEGLRTKAQQAEKVREGNSKTMNSYHLSGLAADICDKKEMWNKGLVRQYWWDMYQIAKDYTVSNGYIRCGIVWDHPERAVVYKQALDDLIAGKITQKQADDRITYFCDVAHIELHIK